MAENDQEKQDERGTGDDDSDSGRANGPGLKDYLKLGGTILITLLLFTGFVRGCAACQKKNPLTGEEIQQPAPPPPPPAAPPQQ